MSMLVDASALLQPPQDGGVERWAEQLLARTKVALLLADHERLLYANPAARRLLGWGEAEPLGALTLLSAVAPEDRDRLAEQLQRRLAGEPGHFWDLQGLRRDGVRLDLRLYGQRVRVDGRVADLITLFDISETREALRQAEWQADLLARSEQLSHAGSYVLSWPEGVLRPSQGLRELTGERAATHLTGDGALAWVAPEDRARVAQAWQAATPGTPFELQHRALGPAGQLLQLVHRGVLQPVSGPASALQGIGLVRDITRQHEAEQRVQTLAQFDALTGLANRAHFLNQVASRSQIAHWDRVHYALMVVELPQVQELRGTLGHAAAENLLLAVASRLNQLARDHEVVARVSGLELALMTGTGATLSGEQAHERARALLGALQAPVQIGATELLPRCRIGLALYPGDGQDAVSLLEAAEKACALADETAGVAFAKPEAHAQALREMQLAAALRHAIEQDGLSLHYQPQVSLSSGELVGVEALLRWHGTPWGEVPPAEFIGVAERAGLIHALGQWVLRTACRQWGAWHRSGVPVPRVAVNVSPYQLGQGDLAAQVQQVLLDTDMDPRALGIELTESGVMDDPVRAGETLRELRALGVEVSLDDFGTGYSSLSALRSLPIDVVKLDRSFVSDMTLVPESASLIRAIILMAHGLHLKVLAEGVESEGQLSLLVGMGCDQIQGFWFSTPLPAEVLAERLRAGWRLDHQHTTRRDNRRTLLLVDDEENILAALKRLLRRDGYEILTATDATQALQCLAEHPVDVILSDQRMPGMTGVEFLHRAAALHPDTVRMTLSGFTDLQSIIDAVNEGSVYKFLTKPWEDDRLRAHVAEAFQRKGMADENRRLTDELATANSALARVNAQLSTALERQREQALLLQASVGGVREILDSLPVAVLGLDPEDLLVYANGRAHQLFPPGDLALGLPARPGVAALRGLGAVAQGDVHGQPCQVWRHCLAEPTGANRGEVLVCLPVSSASCPGDSP